MITKKLGLGGVLRAAYVKRWHIVNTTRTQTLAEHAYTVAIIAGFLFRVINDTDTLPCGFTEQALMHDASESITGDIPTPAKAMIRDYAGSNVFDRIDEDLHSPNTMNTDYYRYIRMADLIDAAVWIRENGAGAEAKEIASGCWDSMEWNARSLGEEWVGAVNHVLAVMKQGRGISR